MIRNKLSELLSERNLKITQVAKDTGISRNTITATSQNDSKMIQLETVNILCKYLGVTPCDFFSYEPLDFIINLQTDSIEVDFTYSKTDSMLKSIKHSFDIFIDIQYKTKVDKYSLRGLANYTNPSSSIDFTINFETEEAKNRFNNIRESLPTGFKVQLVEQLEFEIANFFDMEINDYLKKKSHSKSTSDFSEAFKISNYDLTKNFMSDSFIFVPF